MKIRLFALIVTLLPVTSLPAQPTLPPAAPPYFRVRYEPSIEPGELAFGVSYTVWIPAGVKTLRGV